MSGISGISSSSYSSLYGQIASGNKLPSAAHGAAELSIVEKQNTQTTGYDVGANNMKSGQDLLNISDAALGGITDYLQRMRELALQASNTAVVSSSDQQNIQEEIDQLKQGIQDIATQTQYNTQNLLDGSRTKGFELATDAEGNSVTINNNVNATLDALGIADFDVTGDFNIDTIDQALKKISDNRSSIGAQTNRLDYGIRNNIYSSYNTTAAKSRLGDTDYPQAISELKKKQALQQYALVMQRRKMQDESRRMQNFFAMG